MAQFPAPLDTTLKTQLFLVPLQYTKLCVCMNHSCVQIRDSRKAQSLPSICSAETRHDLSPVKLYGIHRFLITQANEDLLLCHLTTITNISVKKEYVIVQQCVNSREYVYTSPSRVRFS